MNRQKYLSLLQNIDMNRYNWKLIAMALSLSNLLLILLVFSISKNEKTIVMPSHFQKSFWIEGSSASVDYVEQIGQDVFQAVLTYNPSNVAFQFATVLKYVHPRYYQDFKSILDLDSQRAIKNQISSVFYPMSFKRTGNEVVSEGEQVTLVGQEVVSRKIKKFKLSFVMDGGSVQVTSFSIIEKEKDNG